uniref:Uncharacterized protein n=1 Tax=Aegilops tauschii subsp. strangulata TaxID=200361 RepID=A0A452YA37_AEGTS
HERDYRQVQTGSGTPWWMSVVYRLQEDDNKIAFLQELRDIRLDCAWPWMICDDFNLIYRDEDKKTAISITA